MRDPDRAWEYGSREIEREANADAMPPPGYVICSECDAEIHKDDAWVRYEEVEVDGIIGDVGVYTCDNCFTRDWWSPTRHPERDMPANWREVPDDGDEATP